MIILDKNLKVCPFCGSDPVMFEDYRYRSTPDDMWVVYGVECSNTDCIAHQQQKYYTCESNARMAWNRRVNNEQEITNHEHNDND